MKGHKFSRQDVERMRGNATMRRLRSRFDSSRIDALLDADAARLTEQFRIVAMDGGYPVIASELTERIVRRLGEAGRPAALDLLKLDAAVRVKVLAAFDNKTGELLNPFPAAKG